MPQELETPCSDFNMYFLPIKQILLEQLKAEFRLVTLLLQ